MDDSFESPDLIIITVALPAQAVLRLNIKGRKTKYKTGLTGVSPVSMSLTITSSSQSLKLKTVFNHLYPTQ